LVKAPLLSYQCFALEEKLNLIKINLDFSFKANSFVSQIEANHNKDYSVVKTFKAGGNSRFLFVK
jgi:hypothetical protein